MARIEFELEKQQADFDKSYFFRLLNYLTRYRGTFAGALFFIFLSSAMQIAFPFLIKLGIDQYMLLKDFPGLARLVGLFGVGLVINLVARRQHMYLAGWIGQRVLYDIRSQVFSHLQKLSFRFYDSRPSGKIMSRLTSDVRYLRDFLTNGLILLANAAFSMVGIIWAMFSLDARLALVSLVTLPFIAIVIISLRIRIRRAHLRVRETMANINANLQESISGVRLVQAYVRQKTNESHFDKINYRNLEATMDSVKLAATFNPVVEISSAGATALVIWFGANWILADGSGSGLTVGVVVAFVVYLQQLYDPVRDLSNIYNSMQSAMASADRIFGILDTSPEIVEKPGATDLSSPRGRIVFDHVTFGYDRDQTVLENIDLQVPPGETIALVGPTGAGKSSMINLVARFYDPQEGRILFDGVDLRDITLQCLRREIAIVLQDSFLFSGTIRDNIGYGRQDASDAEIVQAAKAVHAHRFIQRMPQGYGTEVHERGEKLSEGQRQLLAFARALLMNPTVLILDEATSNVDAMTEVLIQKALAELLADRTAFVIAHRLSTIRNADRILVIQDGRIQQTGTHRELMSEGGLYRELNEVQFRYDHLTG